MANFNGGKEVYLPKKISTVPDNNDFNNNESEYSNKRSAQTENFMVYWAKEYGNDPLANNDLTHRFDIRRELIELERFYKYYVEELKIIKKGSSVSDKYKILFFITGGKNSTAYGWGVENKVGILWSPAVRINKEPYGVLAHELGHVFQFLAECDNSETSFKGAINEMGAQYMLWQVYPDWLTFENYHLKGFLANTHHAFLHPVNAYHSPFVIEYWAAIHGEKFYGKLLRAVKKGEDPVQTYKRINRIDQAKFNDEMFDASRRFVTWDIKRVNDVAKKYANQHYSKLIEADSGWLRIAPENCPESYGYNAIKLNVPAVRTNVAVKFQGLVSNGNKGSKEPDAGWRFGFAAYIANGSRVYSKIHSGINDMATFKVPQNTKYLWLIVTAAPPSHVTLDRKAENIPKYPYQIKLSGTSLNKSS
ncbi:DUF6055 domain-containing protein [Pedobacter heparinus]|uniref:DUF6055 domain-containing protein n=1 Tax=Pedobacter heparinus TaxID=984 RepID=UPI002930B527|nr:DUF6055 domain-containing protein [Pedobacter heparinus]